MTETAYPKLDLIEGLIKETLWDGAINSILGSLFASAPYLRVWPVGAMITRSAHYLGDKLFAALKLIVDLKAIPIVNETHRKAFDRASVKLQIVARNHGIESEEFKKARSDAHEALAKFASFGGR